ncbi:MAG: hypothetical protein K0Q90_3852 [Paenibacillaceae bacterium]|jgi:arginine utilization protein RocB|nr:hypothetical protein [Paenibacillaceae bacterium]
MGDTREEQEQSRKWSSPGQLRELLAELVRVPSVTGAVEEAEMAEVLKRKLEELDYFQAFPDQLRLTPAGNGTQIVTALVRKPGAAKTILLISHHDVVGISDYGSWEPLAWELEDLTAMLINGKEHSGLPGEVLEDLAQTDETWLFGRGVMDMKCGVALHMSLLEKAADGEFDGNLLMLSVPDEEVNSAGMRKAVPLLVTLAQEWGLDYRLALNSEPVFPRHPGDNGVYIYTGSIGKMLPGYLCYGRETHAGEPFSGFNANYMAAVLTAELEWSAELSEFGPLQSTPPPTNLLHRDLSPGYSAQVPHRAAVLFNLLQMDRPARKTLMLLKRAAYRAASRMEEDFYGRAMEYAKKSPFPVAEPRVNVFTYEELYALASERHGETATAEAVNHRIAGLYAAMETPGQEPDGREATIAVADALAALCKDLAPMVILFVAPPFYPAVAAGEEPLVRNTVERLAGYATDVFGLELAVEPFFRGISDLSYIGSPQAADMIHSLAPNMPLWGRGYEIPFDAMSQLQMPVLNIGPVGRDAHKRTERLEAEFAFRKLPQLLTLAIRTFLEEF